MRQPRLGNTNRCLGLRATGHGTLVTEAVMGPSGRQPSAQPMDTSPGDASRRRYELIDRVGGPRFGPTWGDRVRQQFDLSIMAVVRQRGPSPSPFGAWGPSGLHGRAREFDCLLGADDRITCVFACSRFGESLVGQSSRDSVLPTPFSLPRNRGTLTRLTRNWNKRRRTIAVLCKPADFGEMRTSSVNHSSSPAINPSPARSPDKVASRLSPGRTSAKASIWLREA